jgi:hypothetical protein
VLRRLANERSKADPLLHERSARSVIDDHFDKSSHIYAPKTRDGKEHKIDHTKFDVLSRTAVFGDMDRIADLESTIPKKLLSNEDEALFSPLHAGELFSSSAPLILGKLPANHLLDDRLTSAARRDIKNTKRDVDEMNRIIQQGKRASTLAHQTASSTASATEASKLAKTGNGSSTANGTMGTVNSNSTANAATLTTLSRRVKGRPVTPDLAVDDKGEARTSDNLLQAAVIALQSAIRGRAVQNIMIEGRYRRRELLAELRAADKFFESHDKRDAALIARDNELDRDHRLKETTQETVMGGVASNLLFQLSNETVSDS